MFWFMTFLLVQITVDLVNGKMRFNVSMFVSESNKQQNLSRNSSNSSGNMSVVQVK